MKDIDGRTRRWTLLVALVSMFCVRAAWSQLPAKRIHIDGDLMIGLLADFTDFHDPYGCNKKLDLSAIEIVELVTHLLERANAKGDLPVTLGLTVYNDCDVDKYSLAQAVHFLKKPSYIVVLCCKKSAPTEMVSHLTAVYQIPQISYASVLKDWTDTRVANYLLRTVAPKEFQINAIIDIMKHYGWSYVSVIYLADSFGERSMRRFEVQITNASICIEYSRRVVLQEDFSQVANDLLAAKAKARVVLLFIYSQQITALYEKLAELNATRKFIWLTIATWNYMHDINISTATKEVGLGGFSLKAQLKETPSVFDFLREPTAVSEIMDRNPWFPGYWETCRCKWQPEWQPANESCSANETLKAYESCGRYYYASSVHDAFRVVIEGLKNYAKERNVSAATATSFDRTFFYECLKNVSFDGLSGTIDFDHNGDNLCEYRITQVQYVAEEGKYVDAEVGHWSGRNLTLRMGRPEWYVEDTHNGSVPSSRCSSPCKPNEMKVEVESTCCWESQPCYVDEILERESEECTQCPSFTWPDQDFAHCIPIRPTFVTIDVWMGIAIAAAAAVGFVMTAVVFALYVKNRMAKLVEATCREASFISLIGIGLNFASLFIFIGEPTVARCSVGRFVFHQSFSLIYAPVLIKIVRIYRLFAPKDDETTQSPPQFISARAQVGVTLLLVAVQIALTGALIGAMPVGVEKRMPDRRVHYVELLCQEPLPAFIISTSLNLILLMACAIIGMKTRKLPQHYNEAAYIAICCNTALILVAIYIPTYFTMDKGGYKILIMCVTQTLNGMMALGLLYVPILYAIYFVRDEKIVYDVQVAHQPELRRLSRRGKDRHWST